ncbi:MAG: alpha/beta fold hydrolase [Hyphomicrobiales bacterium]|nr:alpha/beta fold hydrolase [Hyphomicrobiales bacterium]MCP5372825.1 alpha/beta fold hydrolase [Hyphomicrobiales bacterium]
MNGPRIPLLLLPGLLCDAALWRHQVAGLADVADCTVPDLTRDDSLTTMAERVLADYAPPRFALAGLSMGGYLAQEIMRRAPHRVDRLALLDTTYKADTAERRANRRGLMELAGMGRFRGVTPRLMPLLLHPDRQDDTALTDTVMAMADAVGMDGFLRQQQAIMDRADGAWDLPRLQCPVLVLCGRQDALTPLADHQEMAAMIPNATLVVVEDCGHLSTLERPDEVTAALRAWLTA